MKTRLIFTFLYLLAMSAMAQEFSIRRVELAGEQVFIYYDLIDTLPKRTYTVNVYSSTDDFISPLTKLEGDVGLEVRPGGNRKIVWKAKEELGATFEGKVGLEVRGKLYVPFVRFEGFKDHPVRKRGTSFDVVWSGGRASSLINFELLRDDKLVSVPHTNVAASIGKITVKLPSNIKPGDGYRFKIVDSKNKEDVVYTDGFTIRRKYSLGLKAGVLLGVGTLAYLLIPKPTEPDPEIEDPIIPPKR